MANPQKMDAGDRTPLMVAAVQGDIEAARGALEYAKQHSALEGQKTALMFAAERGFADVVALLAPLEARLTTDFGSTALMYAAMAGHLPCAQLLYEAERGMLNRTLEAALIYAAYYGHEDVCALLAPFEAGLYNEFGEFALVYGVQMNFPRVCQVLLPYEGAMRTTDGRTVADIVKAFEPEGRSPEALSESRRAHEEIRVLVLG